MECKFSRLALGFRLEKAVFKASPRSGLLGFVRRLQKLQTETVTSGP